MRFRSFIPWILVALPVAIPAFGCYGATQVTVALSTDLTCDGSLDTLLYKGAPRTVDSTPNAETKSCTAGSQAGADNGIGTLTLTPSGDKSAQVEVRAVLARNGKDPSKCEVDATDCIVQTRTFSFSEHASQTISIRLLEECVGTVCPEGQTCVAAGQCSSNQLTCTGPGGCADAGADASVDGGATVVPACAQRGAAKNGVLATAKAMPGPQLSALVRATTITSAAVAWADSDGNANRVAVDGSTPALSVVAPAPIAVTDGRDGRLASVFLSSQKDGTKTVVSRGTSQVKAAAIEDPESIAARSDFAIVGSKQSVWRVSTGGNATEFMGSGEGQRVAVTASTAYAATGNAVQVFPLGGGTSVQVLLSSMGGTPVTFAVNPTGDKAYAAGATPARNVVIADLTTPATAVATAFRPTSNATATSDPPIVSLAVDTAHVYFTHGNDGVTVTSLTGKSPVSLYGGATNGSTIDHLEVDNLCLYLWEASEGNVVLRSIAKATQ